MNYFGKMKHLLVLLMFAAGLAQAADGKTEVLWLGQSAVRISTPGGKVILVDPFLTKNPKTPEQYKNLDALGHVDLILVTHGHADHLGDAPEIAKRQNIPVIAVAGLNQSLATLGILPPELAPRMNKSGTITPFDGIKITMVHAEHTSEVVWHNPATNKDETHTGGEPVGFIIEVENGFKIYHMGDTGLFSDMKFIADYYKPDLVLIPIGGHFVMSPQDAAYAVRYWLKPHYVLPIHYGTFPVLKGTPEEFIKAIGPSRTKVLDLKPGGSVSF
jgi:L-ascorbate metabolism protein UlaG (beta-lactamase superfamily)